MGTKMALFFTSGVSLRRWRKIGNLDREIKTYKKLIEDGTFEEVYFFTYGEDDKKYEDELPDGIKVFPNRYNFSNRVYTLLMPFLYWDRFKEVDLLKTNQMRGGWAAVIAKWLFWNPLVVRCGYEWYLFSQKKNVNKLRLSLVKWLEFFVYKNADQIIISSYGAKKFIMNKFDIEEGDIDVLPNYIDTDLFSLKKKKQEEKGSKEKLCFVGKFASQKNILSLFAAIDGLELSLNLLGGGPMEDELKKKAKSVTKAEINFYSNIPNNKVPDFLNKHSIFVLPSHYEGNPKAILEAMSCGLACIGSDVEGTREIIKDRENGLLCNTSPDSIRKTIQKLCKNKEFRDKLGQNAREFIVDNFSLKKVVAEEKQIINRLIGS